jgi:hypothetical protein
MDSTYGLSSLLELGQFDLVLTDRGLEIDLIQVPHVLDNKSNVSGVL